MHMDVSQEPPYKPQDRDNRFVRAIDMHMDMSQEPIFAEIYK